MDKSFKKYITKKKESSLVQENKRLKEEVEKLKEYGEYLALKIEETINYSEYVSDKLENNIKYSEYIASKLDSIIQYLLLKYDNEYQIYEQMKFEGKSKEELKTIFRKEKIKKILKQ